MCKDEGSALTDAHPAGHLQSVPSEKQPLFGKIVVTQPLHHPVLTLLQQHAQVAMNPGPTPLSQEDLIAWCKDAHGVMVFMTERIDETFLSACRQIRIIAGALKGYNNIDVAACTRRGIPVTVVPDLLTEPTAELTVGLMIAVARHLCAGDRFVRSGKFTGWRPHFFGGSLAGANILVIGAGAVGQAVLRMLAGFDCTRFYVDKKPLPSQREVQLGCRRADLETALPQADFVVLCIHLMPETKHLVDRGFLKKMKNGSYLINPARGSIVNEEAVAEALETGKLAGYAADTFEMEDWAEKDRPGSVPQALLRSEKSVLTPHLGSAVDQVRQAIEFSAAKSIIEMAHGNLPATTVNKDALASKP